MANLKIQFGINTLMAWTFLAAFLALVVKWFAVMYVPVILTLMLFQLLMIPAWIVTALCSPVRDGHLDVAGNPMNRVVIRIWLTSILMLLAMFAIPALLQI